MIRDLYAGKRSKNRLGVIVGTGPSLDEADVKLARAMGVPLFGANRAAELGMDVVLGCNTQFWDRYYLWYEGMNCDLWSTRPDALSNRWPEVRYIREVWRDGISVVNSCIHAHHGSGPQIFNLAYHYGIRTFLLIGWDMRYGGKISDTNYEEPRHFFGEYPPCLQHWPKTGPNGELTGLIKAMETIDPEKYAIKVFNCTPNSALTHFQSEDFTEAVHAYCS